MAPRRIELALGLDDGASQVPGASGAAAFAGSLSPTSEDPGPALDQVLERVHQELGESGEGRLDVVVALLPPLCDVRLVSLPPLGDDETQLVLRRDAARHFIGSNRPLIVGGRRFQTGRGPAPVLAAAAQRTLVDALHRAVEARGWELERIVPAQAAWLAALEDARPDEGEQARSGEDGPGVRVVVAVEEGTAHVIRTVGGLPERIRRVPTSDEEALLDAVGPTPGLALVLAGPEDRERLSAALEGAEWTLAAVAPEDTPRAVAARHAAETLPELVPAPLAWARQERNRRTTVRLLGASVLTLAAAAAVHMLGTVAEYRAVRRERAELREMVAPALAAMDSLDATVARLEELRALGRESSRWTFSLVELSVLLPPETHLVSLRAAGDTAVMEAEGGRAGQALAALRTATTLEDVRIEGTIQRELEDGTTSAERFTLSAILAPQAKSQPGGPGPEGGALRGGSGQENGARAPGAPESRARAPEREEPVAGQRRTAPEGRDR